MKLLIALLIFVFGNAHAEVLVVDPSNPRASDRGGGPYKTIAAALKRLGRGDTLTIKAGVYRESLKLPKLPGISIEGESGTLIKGSDIVSGWEALSDGVFVKRDWEVNSQQVFVDGVSLQQIGGSIFGDFPDNPSHEMYKAHKGSGGIWPGRVDGDQQSMPEHSFYYDAAAHDLYVKSSGGLKGKIVEVSTRPLAYGDDLKNVRLSNIAFMHANGTASGRSPAVRLGGNGITIDNIKVTWTDGAGIGLIGDDNTLRNSVSNYNGQLGVAVRGRNARLINNETSYNNQRGFNQYWEAGGGKFIGKQGAQRFEVSGHKALYNNGDGIWFDGASGPNRDNTISNSISAYNAGHGIHYEVSGSALITNNHVFGNKLRGIYLANSFDSVVEHNLVAMNGLEGIAAVNDRRATEAERSQWLPRNNQITGNIVAWNKKRALVLPEEGLGNTSNCNLFVDDAEPSYFMGWHRRTHPPVNGLTKWQAMSGQDRASREKVMGIPESLSAASTRRQIDLDWNALLGLARGTPETCKTQRFGPAPS